MGRLDRPDPPVAGSLPIDRRAAYNRAVRLAPLVPLLFVLASPPPCAAEARLDTRPPLVVQILRFPPGATPESYFRSLAAAGVTEAIVRVFSNPGDRPLHDGAPALPGVLFRSDALASATTIWTEIREAADAAGIRAYPWMATRLLTGSPDDFVEAAFLPGRGVVPTTRGSLFDPRFLGRLRSALNDLGNDAGGAIYLQDDWLHRWGEPLSAGAIRACRQEAGLEVDAEALFPGGAGPRWADYLADPGRWPLLRSWFRWKADTAASMIVSLGANKLPGLSRTRLIPSIPYEVPADPERGLAWYGLSLDAFRKHGVSEVAVMAYHRQMGQEMGISGDALRDYLRRMAAGLAAADYGGGRSSIKLQGIDWTDGSAIAASELDEVVLPFREAGFTRFCVVLSGIPFPAGFPARVSP